MQNASIHSKQIIDKNRIAILAAVERDLAGMIATAEAEGKGLHIATVIGAPPKMMIAGRKEAPEGVDEIDFARVHEEHYWR